MPNTDLNGYLTPNDLDGKRIYLAGPMTGIDRFNFPAFLRAAIWLRARRLEVFNPAESFDGDTGRTRAEYMRIDYRAILDSDVVLVLRGWESSHGALRELTMALDLGYQIIELQEWNAPSNNPRLQPRGPHCFSLKPITPDIVVKHETPVAPEIEKDRVVGLITEASEIKVPWKIADAAGQEIRIKNAVTGGEKGSKLERVDLIPAEAIEEIGRVYGLGAQKYAAHNWRKGYAWSLSIAAAFRHMLAISRGEDRDTEFGTYHAAHVVFHMCALIVFATEHPELDDRFTTKGAA